MPVTELRCTSCNAPVETGATSGALRCRYCGATLMVSPPAPTWIRASADDEPPPNVHIEYFLLLASVGPSNRPRVAKHVAEHARVSVEEAERLVAGAPCEIPFGSDPDGRASALERLIGEDGGEASVEKRFVLKPTAPVLPKVDVFLDEVGPKKLLVINAVRSHLELDIAESKHLVESAPCVLARRLEGARAKALVDGLATVGAKARIS